MKREKGLCSECGLLSAVQVGPAGGVRVEVVLAQAGRVVSGCEHVGGRQRGGEVVARLVVDMEVVLVERLELHGDVLLVLWRGVALLVVCQVVWGAGVDDG